MQTLSLINETYATLLQAFSFSYGLQLACRLSGLTFIAIIIRAALVQMSIGLGQQRNKKELAVESIESLQVGLVFAAGCFAVQTTATISVSLLGGYLCVNTYTTFFQMFTLITGRFILAETERRVAEGSRHLLEFATVLTLALLFRLLLISAASTMVAFFAVVGFSLNVYVAILITTSSAEAREAGVKYYYLSTFSSGLIIYGLFLLFALLETTHYNKMSQLLATNESALNDSLALLQFAVLLLLTGVFFKLSAFPGHLWAPDVYEGSPAAVMAFFMLPVKIVILSFLISLLTVALDPIAAVWQPYLAFAATGSLVWGCFGALFEKNTKRFLAYASINQIGFLLVGLTTASGLGRRATIVYIALYGLINIGFLSVYLAARQSDGTSLLYLTDFRGLGQQNWRASWVLAMRLLSIAGIPPLAGFFGKYYLLLHAQEQGLFGLVVVALLTSLASAYYYLRIIKTLWFEGADGITSVVCNRSNSGLVVLWVAEASLWFFRFCSGSVVEVVDVLYISLCC